MSITQEALLFLAKLGDPIANLPDVVDLEVLKQWYEFRFNVNGHLTRKQIGKFFIYTIVSFGKKAHLIHTLKYHTMKNKVSGSFVC